MKLFNSLLLFLLVASTVQAQNTTYIVQDGEILSEILMQRSFPESYALLNPIIEETIALNPDIFLIPDPDLLSPGDELVLPINPFPIIINNLYHLAGQSPEWKCRRSGSLRPPKRRVECPSSNLGRGSPGGGSQSYGPLAALHWQNLRLWQARGWGWPQSPQKSHHSEVGGPSGNTRSF